MSSAVTGSSVRDAEQAPRAARRPARKARRALAWIAVLGLLVAALYHLDPFSIAVARERGTNLGLLLRAVGAEPEGTVMVQLDSGLPVTAKIDRSLQTTPRGARLQLTQWRTLFERKEYYTAEPLPPEDAP